MDSFWVRLRILNISLYFSLHRSPTALKHLVYFVKSSLSFCLLVIRFIMASIITILAFLWSSNDREFSLIIFSNLIGSPLILVSNFALASILCCRSIVHCPNKNVYASQIVSIMIFLLEVQLQFYLIFDLVLIILMLYF